ncbi:MAG: hypothetical protein MJ229_03740, partial [bacterium]|nr:hypothetical protein [bacterium]
NQLKNLNMFRNANLTLEDIPNIKNTLYGRADNSIDFDPEKLLSKYEMTLSAEEQFEIALKREISYEDARKLTQSLNSDYTRATNTKYLTDIGSSKNIICQEPEISKAKSITPENPTKFTESMIESNMVTKELITAYDKMLTSTDGRAAEISERVNKKNIVLTDNSGSEEIVKFEDLFEKAKSNPDKLTPSEIHAITDVFKNEVYVNKATTDFFNPYLNDEICDAKGEFLPQYKQIAGTVESMKNISTKSLNKNVEITDHAFMRLIDRDLINPTTKNGELVSFNELISTANKAVLEAEKTNNLKNVVLKDIYTSEGQEIKLIIKKNASGKIVIESFM